MMKTLKAALHQSRRGGDSSEDPSEKIREVLEEPISSLDVLVVFDLKLRGDGALRNLLVDYLECNTDETKKKGEGAADDVTCGKARRAHAL